LHRGGGQESRRRFRRGRLPRQCGLEGRGSDRIEPAEDPIWFRMSQQDALAGGDLDVATCADADGVDVRTEPSKLEGALDDAQRPTVQPGDRHTKRQKGRWVGPAERQPGLSGRGSAILERLANVGLR
jgi:hypothetical protein